ncbi:MAG: MBL fold metallo-hydrolase [Pirellulaceae bacterium]
MKQAARANAELLNEMKTLSAGPDGFVVWWLGQSGFLIRYQDEYLLFDPYLSDSLTKKYAETDKPHVRMTQQVIDPATLDFVSVVTSSHNHTDHLDAETLLPLMNVNSELTVLVPAANVDFAANRLGVPPQRLVGIDAGESHASGKFTLHAVPAAHETLERDEQGRYRFLGYVAQFGKWTVYHSGDTMLFDDMVPALRQWSIDLALLPINGRAPERRVAGNLWGREAAQLAYDIGAQLVIPCHYDMFEFNTASPDEFVAACRECQQSFAVLENGGHWTID